MSSMDRHFFNLSLTLFFITISFTFCSLVRCYQISKEISPQKIIVWHAMDYALGHAFETLVQDYNQKPEVRDAGIQVVAEFKGTYDQTLDAGLAVACTAQAPHILQVYEMGTLKVIKLQQKKSVIVPLKEVMSNTHFDENVFLPRIVQFYRAHGQFLNSVPFNTSTVILYYNKTALQKAGINEASLLDRLTWEDFINIADRLKKQGAQNILAHGWLTGHGIDQTAACHNESIATNGNGVDGDAVMELSKSDFFEHHITFLKELYEKEMFTLKVGAEAEKAFADQEVMFLTNGANRLPLIEQQVKNKFEIGVATFPYWKKWVDASHNKLVCGASLWVMAGHATHELGAIADFLKYVVSVPVQKKWHMMTGYVPVVHGVREICEQEGFYEASLQGKASLIALESLMAKEQKEYTRGILLPNFPEIRKIQIEEMTKAIKNEKSVKDALKTIDEKANELLKS